MSAGTSSSDINVKIETSGLFKGLNKTVCLTSVLIVLALIVWVGLNKDNAAETLGDINGWVSSVFGAWYVYIAAFYLIICLSLAIWPRTGRVKLGQENEKPEFSNFSWFSMMFGAGLGVGMLTYAVAEPVIHFRNNPDVIKGAVVGATEANVRPALKWAIFHYALIPWAMYGILGMVTGYFAYNRGMPLSMRSGLQPIFGKALSGWLGHFVDVAAIIATISGVGYTIGLGVKQFAFGVHNLTGMNSILGAETNEPVILALLACLLIIMLASTLSAISGVGKGIKWLSNTNMVLSFALLLFFAIIGATSGALVFAVKHFFLAIWDYMAGLPVDSLTLWSGGSSKIVDGASLCLDTSCELSKWQGWTVFYWAWWIAFAPFVGLFLARVSRGRSIREYVLGAMIVPSLMCLVWFALAGGSAIHAELFSGAAGDIIGADDSNKLYKTVGAILSEGSALLPLMTSIIVVLLITYLVTSADSAILVLTTIASGGQTTTRNIQHILFWAILLAIVISVLIVVGGVGALGSVMLIGALPFSVVMALMGIGLVKDLLSR